MRSATETIRGSFPAKLLAAVFGVLLFLAAASPYVPHSQAPIDDGQLVYDVGSSDPAVLPKLERDQRQRAHPAMPPAGDDPVLAIIDYLVGLSPPAQATVLAPAPAPARSHHLEERTSPSRAPPILV